MSPDEPHTRRRGDMPSKLERWGMLGFLVLQFGYHETSVRALEKENRDQAAAIATVAAATDERRDSIANTVARLEKAGEKQADAIADLRDIVVDLRAATRRQR